MSEYRLFKVIRTDESKYFDIEYVRDVVTCGECAKRMREDCPMCNGCKLDRVPTEDDDFCSYGIRSEKPNNSTISKMEQVQTIEQSSVAGKE